MVTETTNNELNTLLPERYPQHDLFICDVSDAILKDVMQHMEHPFYALSKKPETNVRRYEHNGNWLEITPSVKGLATIYDKDILIYSISQIMAKLKRGETVHRRVRINSRELLMFTNRGTSGRDYIALVEALDRLEGTRIRTNIVTGDEEQIDGFGLIDASSVRRKHGLDGRLLWCEVVLSDWVFNAIQKQEVLTLHRDYFRLRKPLERRVYEIARKHCGPQSSWKISLGLLLKKSGSLSPEKRFRQMIRHLVAHDHLPDYHVTLHDDDMVEFSNRGAVKPYDEAPAPLGHVSELQISDQARAKGRDHAKGWDIYGLESEWRMWVADKKIRVKDADSHFIAFCKRRGPYNGSLF